MTGISDFKNILEIQKIKGFLYANFFQEILENPKKCGFVKKEEMESFDHTLRIF